MLRVQNQTLSNAIVNASLIVLKDFGNTEVMSTMKIFDVTGIIDQQEEKYIKEKLLDYIRFNTICNKYCLNGERFYSKFAFQI